MASPDLDDGWIKLSHELLCALCSAGFTKPQAKIVDAMFAQIFGPAKAKVAIVSPSSLAEDSGELRQAISRGIAQLVTARVISRVDGVANGVRFIKDYEKWTDNQDPERPRFSTKEIAYIKAAPKRAAAFLKQPERSKNTPKGEANLFQGVKQNCFRGETNLLREAKQICDGERNKFVSPPYNPPIEGEESEEWGEGADTPTVEATLQSQSQSSRTLKAAGGDVLANVEQATITAKGRVPVLNRPADLPGINNPPDLVERIVAFATEKWGSIDAEQVRDACGPDGYWVQDVDFAVRDSVRRGKPWRYALTCLAAWWAETSGRPKHTLRIAPATIPLLPVAPAVETEQQRADRERSANARLAQQYTALTTKGRRTREQLLADPGWGETKVQLAEATIAGFEAVKRGVATGA